MLFVKVKHVLHRSSMLFAEEKHALAKKQHSFYRTFIEASEVEKKKIKALIHISYDYTPNQYWFNVLFLWVIFFTTFWFLGLMIEAVVILVRSDDAKRKQRHRQKTS